MLDIHQYKKRADRAVQRIKDSQLPQNVKQDIFEFKRTCLMEGLGHGKIYRYLDDLRRIYLWTGKDYRNWDKRDVENLILYLDGKDYSEWTKHGFKILIRKYFRWLRNTEELPPEVKWIKLRVNKRNNRLPEELLTEEDIRKMISCTESYRNKAFISMLYESGCRVGEIMTIKLKNIAFDDLGCKISVFGKTGSRRIRLISSVPYLQTWLNQHPDKENPEAYIWIKRGSRHEIVGYNRMRIAINKIADLAGIKKRVNPHSFRHARASFLANHLTESQLKEVFGWTQSSDMAAVYVHLSGRNTDEAILRVYGKQINKEREHRAVLSCIKCVRCETENEATNKFCRLCGLVLDKDTQKNLMQQDIEKQEMGSVLDNLLKDKEVLELLTRKIQGRKVAM